MRNNDGRQLFSQITSEFHSYFQISTDPAVYRAPGRVNLIGEHTDYNLGYVFPIAIEMACYVAIAPATHGSLRVYSRETAEEFSIPLNEIPNANPQKKWHDYVIGVARQLITAGVSIPCADILIASQVPIGAGLSSSASFEIASALALLGDHPIDPLCLVRLAQQAETNFAGVPCGIMDQYTSVFGRAHAAIQIDCRSLTHSYVRLPNNVQIMVVNSLVKHELGASAYRERVAECREAVSVIQEFDHSVKSLRDVSPGFFLKIEEQIPEIPRRRARHVISETQRVLQFAEACARHDINEMGRLFIASQKSMRHDYDITCEEIDFLVDTAISLPGVYGARMTGGGFGGCTVNLVAADSLYQFQQDLAAAYHERYAIKPIFYPCAPAAGASRVDNNH